MSTWEFFVSAVLGKAWHICSTAIYYIMYVIGITYMKKVKVKVAQSCPTVCNPFSMDCIVHGILQPRTLEWVAFPFSRRSSQSRNQTQVFCITDRFFTI